MSRSSSSSKFHFSKFWSNLSCNKMTFKMLAMCPGTVCVSFVGGNVDGGADSTSAIRSKGDLVFVSFLASRSMAVLTVLLVALAPDLDLCDAVAMVQRRDLNSDTTIMSRTRLCDHGRKIPTLHGNECIYML